MPRGEMPQWRKKFWSSMAITAFCMSTGMRDNGRMARFSTENSAITWLLIS